MGIINAHKVIEETKRTALSSIMASLEIWVPTAKKPDKRKTWLTSLITDDPTGKSINDPIPTEIEKKTTKKTKKTEKKKKQILN